MKNFKLIALVLLAVTLIFSSCTKDEESIAAPTIAFQNGNDALVYDGTTGIDVRIDITAEGKVESFKYTDGTTVTNINAADGETSYSYQFTVSATDLGIAIAGKTELVYTFTLVDKEANTKTATYTVTMPASTPIDSYTAVLMGAQDNATEGSFLATSTGTVYLTADANSNSALVDIIYYYGATNNATACAPNDETVNGGTGNLSLATGLSTKNATMFKAISQTASDFDTYTTGEHLDAITGFSATKIAGLAVNDVIAFETAAGKKGVFKVSALSASASGTITLEVKVQQ